MALDCTTMGVSRLLRGGLVPDSNGFLLSCYMLVASWEEAFAIIYHWNRQNMGIESNFVIDDDEHQI